MQLQGAVMTSSSNHSTFRHNILTFLINVGGCYIAKPPIAQIPLYKS